MCLLIESIRLKNNRIQNIDLHNERLNRSRYELWGISEKIDLLPYVRFEKKYEGVQKVRITYSGKIEKIEIIPYVRPQITHLMVVIDNTIDYSYKFADRSLFAKYLANRNSDILIIKNGFVTDTSFSNLAFFDEKNWYTPSTPLLKGTMRKLLIKSGKIIEKEIKLNDIKKYSKMRLINAFNDFSNPFELAISAIHL